MTRYGTLRTWALVLKVAGFFMVVFTLFGVVVWAFEVEGFWQTLGVIFIGAPVAIFVSTWGIALGQALNAIADIGDAVGPTAELLTGRPLRAISHVARRGDGSAISRCRGARPGATMFSRREVVA